MIAWLPAQYCAAAARMRGWSMGDNASQCWRVSAAEVDGNLSGKSLMAKSKGDVEMSPVK